MRRILKLTLGILVLLALWTWAPLHSWDDEAIVYQKDGQGMWVRQGPTDWEIPLSMRISRFQTTGVSTPPLDDSGAFSASRVWILNLTSGRAGQVIGKALQESLLGVPSLTEVNYFPSHDMPLDVRRPPDLFVTIDVQKLEQSQLPLFSSQHARVHMTASRRLLQPDASKHAELNGRRLECVLDFQSSTQGLLSRAQLYDDLAKHSLRQLDLAAQLTPAPEQAASPPIPLDWAGVAGQAPTDLPLIDDPEARLVASTAPLPWLEEHTWLLPGSQNSTDRISAARDSLEEAGWSIEDTRRTGDEPIHFLHARLGQRSVEVFELNRAMLVSDWVEPRKLAVFHQRRPEPEALLSWLRAQGQAASPRQAAQELVPALQSSTQASLRLLLADGTPTDQDSWLREALAQP